MTREQETTSEEIDEAIKEIRRTFKYLIDEVIVDFGTREQKQEVREEFGSKLRSLREENGISLNSFAKKTGFDPGHVSRMERGLMGISNNYIHAASEELDTSTLDLLIQGGYLVVNKDRITDRDFELFRIAVDNLKWMKNFN